MCPIRAEDREKILSEIEINLKKEEEYIQSLEEPIRTRMKIIRDFLRELNIADRLGFGSYLYLIYIEKEYERFLGRWKEAIKHEDGYIIDPHVLARFLMAQDDFLWNVEFGKLPEIEDEDFLRIQSRAREFYKPTMKGRYPFLDLDKSIRELFKKRGYFEALHQKLVERLNPAAKIKTQHSKPTKTDPEFIEIFRIPAVGHEVKKLIVRNCFNNGSFDHTAWELTDLAHAYQWCKYEGLLNKGQTTPQIRGWYLGFGLIAADKQGEGVDITVRAITKSISVHDQSEAYKEFKNLLSPVLILHQNKSGNNFTYGQ